jgi:sigma-54 dependent dga operon transcriptional activator
MVERIVVSRRPLEIPESMIENVDEKILSVIKVSFKNIESTYDINLSDGEVYYIYDLLFT